MTRLFIGGLLPDINDEDVRTRFSRMPGVHVDGVEIIRTKDGICKGFGYVDLINTNEEAISSCMKMLNKAKWKGQTLKVEMAKPNYLERIKLEKEEEEKEKNQALMADQQEITSNSEETLNRDYLRIRKSKKIVYKMYLKSNIEQVSELKNQFFPHVKTEFLPLSEEDHKRVQEETSSSTSSTSEEESSEEEASEDDQTLSLSERSTRKRLQAQAQMQKNYEQSQWNAMDAKPKRIRFTDEDEPPSTTDNSTGKKVVSFNDNLDVKIIKGQKVVLPPELQRLLDEDLSDSEIENHKLNPIDELLETKDTEEHYYDHQSHYNTMDEYGIEKEEESKPITDWMDSEEEENHEDPDLNTLSSLYEGEEGQKLLHLQKHIGSDPRFRMDERFKEETEPSTAPVVEETNEEEKQLQEERENQRNILFSLLGQERKVEDPSYIFVVDCDGDRKVEAKNSNMLHYDPLSVTQNFTVDVEEEKKPSEAPKEVKKVTEPKVPAKPTVFQAPNVVLSSLFAESGDAFTFKGFGTSPAVPPTVLEEQSQEKHLTLEEKSKINIDNVFMNSNNLFNDSAPTSNPQESQVELQTNTNIVNKVVPTPWYSIRRNNANILATLHQNDSSESDSSDTEENEVEEASKDSNKKIFGTTQSARFFRNNTVEEMREEWLKTRRRLTLDFKAKRKSAKNANNWKQQRHKYNYNGLTTIEPSTE